MIRANWGPNGCGDELVTLSLMATLRLFASAREAAGRGSDTFEATTVGDLLQQASQRYGSQFVTVLGTCRVWLNGESTENDAPVGSRDEVAVLPPVSGGL